MQIFAPVKTSTTAFEKYEALIKQALDAVHKREHYSPFPEMPSPADYGEGAEAEQKAKFEAQLEAKFDRLQQSSDSWLESDEESPFTGKALKISYPAFSSIEALISASQKANEQWKLADAKTRAGLLVETLQQLKSHFYELAFATMHTTGQSYMMSFQASGPHAADRALESIALGYSELTRFADKISWEKPAGKFTLKLEKLGMNVGRGLALAIGCSTFPTWNTLPGLYASLITGNAVIVKPHPKAIYPIALVVSVIQSVLKENGFDPNLVLLACDKLDNQITKKLAENPAIKIIDFTGSNAFGDYIEGLPGKIVFTEKAGVNSIIIDSIDDLDAMAKNIAFSISLYSGQMCTAPQNIYVPESGIAVKDGHASLEDVEKAIVDQTRGLIDHPKAGYAVAGAIQSKATMDRVMKAKDIGGKVLLENKMIANPDFPEAHTQSPIIIELNKGSRNLVQGEMFGPIVFIIPTKDTNESLELASKSAREKGAITCGAYTEDETTMHKIAMEMAEAGTAVSFNLTGGIYVNQNASFSDFHVSGGNPAGNASFTNPEFIVKRFVRIQSRIFVK